MHSIWKITLLTIGWTTALAQSNQPITLANERVKVSWKNTPTGWAIGQVAVRKGAAWVNLATPSGENTLLYAAEKPSDKPDTTFKDITGNAFPSELYHYQQKQWAESTNPVSLNKAGKATYFFPKEAKQTSSNSLSFQQETDAATIRTVWSFDATFPSDIIVKQTVTAKKPGYFSLASPTLASVSVPNLAWATIPGYFQGNKLQPNFALAYAYGHGIQRYRPCIGSGAPAHFARW